MDGHIHKKDGPWNYKSHNSILLLTGIFILLFLLAKVPTPEYFLSDSDGGCQLAGAMQISFGGHPFIDFRSTYGPLTFYASALGQILSGNRIIGEIILIVVGYGVAYLLLFELFFGASRKLSISSICLCFALLLMPRFYKYYIILGPILALYSAWKYIDNRSTKSFLFMSFAVAITGLYRFDFGIYTALCGLTTIILTNSKQNIAKLLKPVGVFLLVIVGLASPWLLWGLYKGGLANYVGDTLSGILNQGVGLSLPFPRYKFTESVISNGNITFGLFVFYNIIPATSLAVLFTLKEKLSQNEKYKIFATLILAQLTLIQAAHRSDFGHLLQSIPIGFVLIAWLLGVTTRTYVKTTWKTRKWLSACMAVFVFVAGATVVLSTHSGMLPDKNINDVFMNLKSLRRSNDKILRYVKAHDPENEYVLVIDYVTNNTYQDSVILAIPYSTSLYYFAGRKFGGGQMVQAPGSFSSENDQRIMVEKLKSEHVELIVEIPDFSYDGLESRKMSNFAPIVTQYVSENYAEVNRVGKFSIKAHRERTKQGT